MLLRKVDVKMNSRKVECSHEETFYMTSIRNALMKDIFIIFIQTKKKIF